MHPICRGYVPRSWHRWRDGRSDAVSLEIVFVEIVAGQIIICVAMEVIMHIPVIRVVVALSVAVATVVIAAVPGQHP